jgi:tripartite ATP-independent transporter DctP family solute receptor
MAVARTSVGRRMTVLGGVAIALALVAGPAGAAETLRLSMNTNEQSPWFKGAQKFKELVEARSRGAYTIRIFPNAQLFQGNDKAEIAGVQEGTVAFVLKGADWLTSLDPRMSVGSLPFLFPNHDVAERTMDGSAGEQLMSALPRFGLVGLAWGVGGFRQITNNKREIRTPDDMKGLKMRVPGARLFIETHRTLGADPTPMPFAEVFTALQNGVMDGQENPYSLIHASRFYEVQKFLTECNYIYSPIAFIANRARWEKFSPQEQAMFRQAAREAMVHQRQVVRTEDRELPAKLEAGGMKITRLTPAQLAAFKERMRPVYQAMEKDFTPELIQLFQAEAARP